MFSNSRGIMYSSPPTAEENTEREGTKSEEAGEPNAAEAEVTEANANWAGELAADD